MRAIRRFTVRPMLPEPLAALDDLAVNLRWSWHTPTRELFESIDADLWRSLHGDPVTLLGSLSSDRLDALAADDAFVARVRHLAEDLADYLRERRWYQGEAQRRADAGEAAPPAAIAYFSAEFGITGALPQYSGGLGILAGDHLKSASDLGMPIVGVGLLYGAGYFRQSLTRDGWQAETYPVLDPDNLPLTLLRDGEDRPVRVSVPLPGGRVLNAQVWRADVGRVPLLLLDSNVVENDDAARHVTDRLYGGTSEHRLQQELLLGMGGVKALREFSRLTGAPEPEVYHCNEGHAGFLGVERMREYIEATGADVDTAVEAVRGGTVFTTHTPVPAGIDRFESSLVRDYFSSGAEVPGVPVERILALGAEDYPGGDPGVFNMAVMGLRLAKRANGVAKLHGKVSRGMFHHLWSGFDVTEVPITSITNGVHSGTWVDPVFAEAQAECFTDAQVSDGSGWLSDRIDNATLWELRGRLRSALVRDARERVRKSWSQRGASPAELGWVGEVLDEDVLTIGFARRVPTYKRLTLMLRDPERLRALLTDPDRPIQIIVAGKSHPADEQGIRLIQQLVQFADSEDVRKRIVFLPNYDIEMAQTLLPGCDVWLNNPLRPLEASGTSGMKSALNGGLNLSILDGWWDEMYDGHNGWAIPTADGVEDPERRDDLEATALYDLLENTVVPRFYDRTDGLPLRWLENVRHTLATLGPKVQATRMVKDYLAVMYGPTAESARALSSVEAAGALAAWKNRVRAAWHSVRVDHVESEGLHETVNVGDRLNVRAFVTLGDLDPVDVQVQMNYGRVRENDELVDFRTVLLDHTETYEGGRHQFALDYALEEAGPFGYTVRIVPTHPEMASDAELGLVTGA
ncbi:alpha-glucan family phosphorylase [Pseudactinotalea sp. HY158]|uniref:alpha-glucan family phosphorylase n=1 Tax=Pseudactinotalea sp. HY158 TaxID=2654547 RepID=UPI00129C9B7D|nr:alpha-glucan family phosphorylase [Pseudactinotalea sp. HY158]QGH68911.1 alpha-glucan family phosphorylase [Pseudactinotalea sp. HY158]